MCLVTENGAEVCLWKVTSFLPEGHGLQASLPLDFFLYGSSVVGESKPAGSFTVCSSKCGVSAEENELQGSEIKHPWDCEEMFLGPWKIYPEVAGISSEHKLTPCSGTLLLRCMVQL